MASKKRRVRQYKWTKRLRKHGFLKRMLTANGRKMLARRRKKGRKQLSPQKAGKKG